MDDFQKTQKFSKISKKTYYNYHCFFQFEYNEQQSNFGESHWTEVKNILNYLRRTKDLF